MARQQFYQPHRPGGRDEDNAHGVYDDQTIPSTPSEQSADVSRGAEDTVGNIDDALADNDSLFNPGGDGNDQSVADKEQGTSEGGKGRQGLYNKEGDNPKNVGGMRGAYGRLQNGRNRLVDKIKKHKWLWGIAGLGGVGVAGGLMLLLIALSSLAIPNLAENVSSYQFAKLFLQSSDENNRILSDKFAIWAADKPTYQKYKAKYDRAGTKAADLWSKLDKYRPNKVIQNMGTDGVFKVETKPTAWGGDRVAGVTIFNNRTLTVKSSPLKGLIPGYKFVSGLSRDQATAIQQYQLALKEGFRINDPGPIVRGIVAYKIRGELGISLTAWTAAKFRNKTEAQARVTEAEEAAKSIQTEDPSTPVTEKLAEDTQKIKEAQAETNTSAAETTSALNKAGVSDAVQKAANGLGKADAIETVLSTVAPVYGVAVPVCIVYDGSLDNSGPSIDARNTAQMREAQYGLSGADQLKDGTDAVTPAIQAFSDRLGDDSSSIPLQRASGVTNLPSSGNISSEASPMGSYSLLNAVFGSHALLSFANTVAGKACPKLTDMKFAAATALGGLLVTIFSGGTADAAGAAANEAVDKVATSFLKRTLERIFVKKAGEELTTKLVLGKTSRFIYGQAKQFAAIAGVTLAAKLYVASKAGITTNGMETGNDLANNIDDGTNLMSNEIMRRQFMGRPLTRQETLDTMGQTTAFLSKQNSQKSAYQRYFALSNPQSFLTLFGMSLASSLRSLPKLPTIDNLLGSIATPFASFSRLFNLNHSFAMAANNIDPVEQNYGNVQFGWSAAEMKLAQEPTYSLSENQRILDASGQEDAIASEYGDCFAQGGENGSGSMGSLLSSGAIVRDSDGNVINKGTCAPDNLGPDDNGNFKDVKAQLVFRWRLATKDNNGLDTALDQQTITADTPATTDTTTNKIGVATYNMCQDTQHHCPYEGTKTKLIANFIISKKLDIIGAEEVSQPTQKGVLANLAANQQSYGSFPSQVSPYQGRAVFWNKSLFNETASGWLGGLYYSNDGNPATGLRRFPWVKLTSNDGHTIFVIATHSPNDGPDPTGSKRAANARVILAWAKQHVSGSDTVIVTGDFNVSGTRFGSNSPYCILTNGGELQHAHDMQDGHAKTPCPTPNPVHYAPLDSIYASTNASLSASGWTWMGEHRLNANQTGTDHSPSYVYLSYPSSGNSSGNSAQKSGWQWPVANADYNGLSQCFFKPTYKGSTLVKAGHTGIDIPVNVGTPVYAAHSGTVVKTDPSGSTDGGEYIILKNGNGLFSNYQHNSKLLVHQGQQVTAGDKIALSGNTGNTTGPHVHFSITTQAGLDSRYNVAYSVDPIPYLPNDRDTGSCH